MEILAYLLLGVVLAFGFVRFAVRPSAEREQRLSVALVVAAFIYVAFAMAAMESIWLLVEICGVLLFVGFVLLGKRMSSLWLAAGWALHAVWDAGLHFLDGASFVPVWYPAVCISFDLVVAAYIVRVNRAAARSNTPSLA